MKLFSVKYVGLLTALLGLMVFGFSCGGGSGGALVELDAEGISNLPYLAYPVDEKLNNLGQIRVTAPGLSYLESQIPAIAEPFLAEDFDVLEGGSLVICSYCGGSGNYCSLSVDLNSVNLTAEAPDIIWVDIELAPINFRLDTTCACNIDVTTNGQPFDVRVMIQPRIDGFTRQLYFYVGDPQFSVSAIDIQLSGVCDFLDVFGLLEGLINAIKNGLEGTLHDVIYDLVQDTVNSFQCYGCEQDSDCPSSPPTPWATHCDTDKGICLYPNNDCVLLPLGIEAEVDVGALAKDFLPTLESKLWASLVAGGYAQCPYSGLDLGMFGGTMPAGEVELCSPELDYAVQTPPRVFCTVQSGQVQEPCNENANLNPPQVFHVGLSLAEELLDQAGASLQDAGLLCLQLDQSMPSVGDYLTTSTFSLILPSIKTYTHREETPVAIQLQPTKQTEPTIDFRIARGEVEFPEPDDPEVDVALVITLDEIKLNIYGLIEERYVRMLTLLLDITVTAGLETETDSIKPIFGLDNVKLEDMRVPFSILEKEPEEIAESLEGLIGGLLGGLALDEFQAIEIPGFSIMENTLSCNASAECQAINPDFTCTGGICLDADGDPYDPEELFLEIQSLSPEIPKDSQGYANRALIAYAKLRWAGAKKMLEEYIYEAETSLRVVDSFLPTVEQIRNEKMIPSITLDIGGQDAEGEMDNLKYEIKIDSAPWAYIKGGEQTIESKIFLLQGKHEIQVRSRDKRFAAWDSSPQNVTFLVDYTEPSVDVSQEGTKLVLKGHDNASKLEALRYEVKVDGGEWLSLEGDEMDLAILPQWPKNVSVKVTDEMGLYSITEKKIGEPVVNTEAVAKTVAGKSVGAAAASGCASSGSVGWLVFLLLLPLAAIRIGRVRAFATVAVIASLFVFALSACSDSGSSGCESNADCGIGQRCVNGACQDVSDGDISGGDMDLPDGDIEKEVAPDGDKDTADGDVEEDDQVIEVPCESHDECPECHYCSKKDKVCKVQACDPECANADLNIPSCIDTMGDSCALCDTEEAIHLCYIPRCTDDNWEDLCSCRTCENGKPPVACRVATGECYCPDDWCQGGCMEGSYCCTPPAELSVDPAGSCVHCPDWCEGILCEPGFAPGGCDPTEDDCGFEWAPCDNIDPATCMAVGEGSPDDPNCECQEMPPLPIGQHGRFNDVEFYTITDDREVVDHLIWVATYNDTYGDLMVGTTYYFQMPPSGAVPEENYHWAFIDGVPSLEEEGVEIEAGPSGPRGGIAEPGPNVGMHTSMMLSADGWPRIAYTDVDNGDLLFIYTDGELAEGVELEEGAEIDPKNYVWHKIIVDADGTTGYYTDMLLDENGYPVITYMTLEIGSSKTSQLKAAMASSASPTSADDFSFVVVDSAPVPGTACGGTCDLENNKCFYQGGQDVCAPETEDCDPGCGDGQVCYNGGCYSERVESSGVKLLPEGVGLNPSTGFYSDGSLWISYYHNSTYSGGEILRRGYLKLAKSNSKPTHSNLAGMGFGKEILAGNEGSLSYGDCGLFSSLAIEPNTGWYAVSFINRLKNELQVIYDLGEGRYLHIADDGWREDGLYTKRFKVGADSQLTINHVGAFVIVYQDQSNSKLNYYSEKCYSDGSCDSDDASFIEVLGMEEGEFGRSYGYYPSLKFIANGVPILSSYGVELLPEEKIYLILQKI